jgi:uncharacterized protein YciI
MTRWVAIFEDHDEPVNRPIRAEHAQAHFDYLAAHAGEILIAGGLRPGDGEWYCGGLWVMEVTSRARAQDLVEGDPYYRLGMRKSCKLLVWGKAPCYGNVVV